MNNTVLETEDDFEVIPFEKCVICNIETDVPVNQHIDFRENYIEGGGQLCKKCFNNLDYKKYIKL